MQQIIIKKTPNGDTRSMETLDRSLVRKDTEQHITDVRQVLNAMADVLKLKADRHDYTKIEYFDNFFDMLSGGTENIKQHAWWNLHINAERHHIIDKKPSKVNLFDILEMIADVNAAGLARTGEVFPINISEDLLLEAFNNTMDLVKNAIVVSEVEEILDSDNPPTEDIDEDEGGSNNMWMGMIYG